MSFFKIPKLISEQVGYLEYQPGQAIDLTACRLRDGTYAIDEETIDLIKANRVAILARLTPNLRTRIRQIIDLNKDAGVRITKEQIETDRL